VIETFLAGFENAFPVIAWVFLVIIAAGLLVRRGIVTQDQIGALSVVTVKVLLPCLTFSSIIRTLEPAEMPFWWKIPLAAAAMVLFGLGAGVLAFLGKLREKRDMLPIASMQNAAYLVLPIGEFLFRNEVELFRLYCFLYVLALNILMWSIGKVLTTGANNSGWKSVVSPPLCANLLGLLFVFTGARRFVPGVVSDAIHLLGTATVPVALFVLGAVLGTVKFRLWPYLGDALRVIGIRLFLLPAVTIGALLYLGVGRQHPMLATLFVVQASAAPATAHLLQIRAYGGNEQKVGSIVLASYVLCVVTMPFWLAVWEMVR
jgi:predicted permease